MTAADIRQSFLDFFRGKAHTIVPSAPLFPQSPGLLFTNAGMNPFVPYFLGAAKAPYDPPRAADTQKCIRAGGKHNDLEDVGYDTYHHTFFEMLGNWSFGDYFKPEAIRWAWELVVGTWGLPASRLYATVYAPKPGDPGAFDQEAWDLWAELFRAAGCDPSVHIVNGNVKDNFWMMGETGPCGPCSELHVDLTPLGDTRGSLVNSGSDLCIEIWNLVFIQYNAEADGSFRELPAKHVDTGMGFERACSIIQGTKGFTDFSIKPSNYATDVFTPLFRKLEELSGRTYHDIYPEPDADRSAFDERMKDAIAFRVIADHLRTLSFSIADGILPGNNGRNYVLRRILRRAVRYGRQLGFSGEKPFFAALVPALADQMGGVFPELRTRQAAIEQTLAQEESAFNQTLDRGLKRFEEAVGQRTLRGTHASSVHGSASCGTATTAQGAIYSKRNLPHFERPWGKYHITFSTQDHLQLPESARQCVLDAILHFHGSRYILFAAAVMPDHVHLLIEPQLKSHDPDGKPVFWAIGDLMHSIKSFTANQINRQLDRTGPVWQKESYDRLIRSDRDFGEKFDYVVNNPSSAGLTAGAPYPFVWSHGWSGTSLAEMRQSANGGTHSDLPQDAEGGTRDACAPLSGDVAFELYDTFGFPIDLTELLCAERGLTVDMPRFTELMEEQQERSRAARKSSVVRALDIATDAVTRFTGFDEDACDATVLEVHAQDDAWLVITDRTPFYAEMGGQTGDTGTLTIDGTRFEVTGVVNIGKARGLLIPCEGGHPDPAGLAGKTVRLELDTARRRPVEAHHTATHLLHWALHEVVSADAAQQGSSVDKFRLRFDFNSAPLTAEQIETIEEKVNERIHAGDAVSWIEVPHASVKERREIMQFFGDKYGDTVRVVQIGGSSGALDGYSMELCGGTHVRDTSAIGLFKIRSEGAVAAGVRRIEAVCGEAAWQHMRERVEQWDHDLKAARLKLDAANAVLAQLGEAPVTANEFPHLMTAMLVERADVKQLNATFAHSLRTLEETKLAAVDAEKRIQRLRAARAAQAADAALADLISGGGPIIASFDGDATLLQELLNGLRKRNHADAAFLVVDDGEKLHLGVHCGAAAQSAGMNAGSMLRDLAAIAGGKGGGKSDQARGAAPDRSKVAELKAAAAERW
jgi:alanyl-tRNA synthetase/REP element-mobilizing transposase RayT